ncbi:putative acyl-activating enzyme 19 isoform X2 [Asparagus officinalis]|nr:putative acyl-activating enzyme 19 isoform X2 [Asparagus officinalis]
MHHSQEITNAACFFSESPRIVGVHIHPSVEYIVAVLSILRCGEAFLPLDPTWPQERIMSIVSSSRTSLIIGCSVFSSRGKTSRSDVGNWIVDRTGCSVLHLSMGAGPKDNFVQSGLVWPCESRNPRKFCYLMYTSGSTGRPKGVCGTETGLLNRFLWMQAQFPLGGEDILLFKTSISFVDHLQEFLSAILTSTTLIVPLINELKANPSHIVNLIKAYGISRLTCVPTLMRTIIPFGTSPWMPVCKSLKLLVLSGEILFISLWKVLQELLPETTILNMYGSTEVSGDCMYFDCKNLPSILEAESLSSVPIGLPIYNCEIDLVGEKDVPDEGEISVKGACVFWGYFGEPLTANAIKYDANPLHFRTGDFAKRLKSGNFVFLGRKDRTIKVSGQRVALEEVENAMKEHPDVIDAAVTCEKAHGELFFLRSFFVMKTTKKLQKGYASDVDQKHVEELSASIRDNLVKKLPSAMIPRHFFCIEQLPLTSSGKIDYSMLSKSQYMPILNRIEYKKSISSGAHLQLIKEAFRDALLVEEISENDDFFLMGGNSISAAHAAHKLAIDMRLLYAFPTPLKLLHCVLHQENLHESSISHSPAVKRAKVLDDTLPQFDRSKELPGELLLEDNGKGTLDICRQLDANKKMSHLEQHDNSLFSVGSVTVHSSLLPASHGMESLYGHTDVWITDMCLPFGYSLSRCNQIMTSGEREVNNAHQVCPLIKIPRCTKGCLQEQWKVLLKSCVDASPLVVYKDGTITLYIGSHSHIFLCIDAVSGFMRWEVKLEGRIECSAAITGDFTHVVVGCYKGKIYFLNSMTGNISWTFQADGEVKMQPVLDKCRNLMWCGSHDHCLYALDYVKRCCIYKISCGGSIYGSPSIDLVQNMIYVASTSGRVIGTSIKGVPFEVIWSYESGKPIFGSLAMNSVSRNVICCLVDGDVLALDSGGHVIWKVTVGGPIFAGACMSSALPSQVLICSRNGSVYSLDAEGGDILWEYQIGDPITASAYVDEHSFIETDPSDPCDRLASICSSSGRIHVLRINPNAKQERAQHGEVPQNRMVQAFAVTDLDGDIFSSPVMIGGRIFVGCRDDYVHCINVVTL